MSSHMEKVGSGEGQKLSVTPLQKGFWATKCPVSASYNPSISSWCFLLAKPKCNKGKEIVNVAPIGQSPGPQHSKEMKSGFRGEHRYPAQRLHTVNKSLFVLAFINRNDRSFSLKFKLLYLECYPKACFKLLQISKIRIPIIHLRRRSK